MTPYEYLKKTGKKRMDELFKFLQFPSVSAKSEHKKDMLACAAWLKDHLKAIGLTARTYPTGGHPVVYDEYKPDKKAPFNELFIVAFTYYLSFQPLISLHPLIFLKSLP